MSSDDWPEDSHVTRNRPADGPDATVDRYGPTPAEPADALVYEEFSCESALLATVRESDRADRWIQSTVVVPIER